MALVFYGKPNCINNRKQLGLLEYAGIKVDKKDILAESWTPDKLSEFFQERPISDCLNSSAPAVKNGIFDVEQMSRAEILKAMCDDPILIRRPLMVYGGVHRVGFDWNTLCRDLDLENMEVSENLEICARA